MPSVRELLKDPNFRKLSTEAQIFGLRKSDPEFKKLSLDAQLHALKDKRFQPITSLPPTEQANRQLASSGLRVPPVRGPRPGSVRTANAGTASAATPPRATLGSRRGEQGLGERAGPLSGTALELDDLQPLATDPPEIIDGKTRLLAERALDEIAKPQPQFTGPAFLAPLARLVRGIDEGHKDARRRTVEGAGEFIAEPSFSSATKTLRGAGEVALPFIAPGIARAAVAAPLRTAAEIAGGFALEEGVTRGGEALGLSPDQAGLAGTVAGFTPVVGTVSRAARLGRGTPKPRTKPQDVPQPGRDKPRDVVAKREAEIRQKAFRKKTEELRKLGEKPKLAPSKIGGGVATRAQAKPSVSEKPVLGKPKKAVGPIPTVPKSVRKTITDQPKAVATSRSLKALKTITADVREPERAAALSGKEAGGATVDFLTGGLAKRARETDPLAGGVGRAPQLPPPKSPLGSKLSEFRAATKESNLKRKTELIDRFAPVEDFIKTATKGKGLKPEKDPFIGARLFAGASGKAQVRVDRLQQAILPARTDRRALTEHAMMERFEELGDRGITEFPGGRTLEEIKAAKRQLESSLPPQRLAAIRQTEKNIRAYSRSIITEAKEAGMISQESFDGIVARNEKYVPLKRIGFLDDKLNDLPQGFKSFSVRSQNIIQEIKGSERDVIDPFESLVRDTYKTVNGIERNKVARQVWDLAENKDFDGLVVRLKKDQVVPGDFERMSVFIDGTKQDFAVPRGVGESLKGLTEKQADFVTRMARVSAAALRVGATQLNIAFTPSNAIRDFQTATLKSEVGFGVLDWMKGFSSAIRQDKLYQEYLDSGAAFSGFLEAESGASLGGFFGFSGPDTKGAAKKLFRSKGQEITRTVLNPVQLLRAASEMIELAPRIGVFGRARKLGRSPEEAAFTARNATVDFSKRGTAMRIINQWVPFLNARTQGTINLAQSFRDRPGATIATRGAGTALKATLLVGVPTVTTYLWNTRNYGHVYDDIAEFEKQTSFIIITGDNKDERGNWTDVMKIPKGDPGRILGNPLENYLRYLDGRDTQTLDHVALEMLSDISPISFARDGEFSGFGLLSSLLPPILKAAIETTTNTNLFTGRPIVPRSRITRARKLEQVPAPIKAAADFIGMDPLKMMNAIGTQFGGLGRQLSSPGTAINQVTRRFSGARGGAGQQKGFDTLDAAIEGYEQRRLASFTEAQTHFNKIKNVPPSDQERKYLQIQEGLTPEVTEALVELLEKAADDITAFERSLKRSPIPARAETIIKQLSELGPRERGERVRRWERLKVLSAQTQAKIKETHAELLK